MKVKEEGEKTDFKLSIQKNNIMASGPIISWCIDKDTMETVKDFYFPLAPLKTVTAAIKRCLLLGRKAVSSLDSILKSKDITLLTKAHIVKAVVFPVDMYGLRVGP